MAFEADYIEGKTKDINFVPVINEEEPIDVLPEREKQERAFYSASFNPQEGATFKQTYAQNKFDLDTLGSSTAVDEAHQDWQAEQLSGDDKIMQDIIADPSIPATQKTAIVNTYRSGGFISKNLRDKYIQKTAALDNADSAEDASMQDNLARGLYNNYQKAKEFEIARHEWESNMSQSVAETAAGMARDFIPGVWNTGNALSAQKAAEYFGLKDKAQMQMAAKAFVLGGTYSRQIQEAFHNTLDPEQKKAFFMHLMEGAKQLPGFDYNQWSILQAQIDDQPMKWWEEVLLNIASIGDLVGVGQFVRNPVRWLKGLYTYEDSKLAQAVMSKIVPVSKNIPQAERVEPKVIVDTVSDQAAKASSEATGVNNGIVSPTVDETITSAFFNQSKYKVEDSLNVHSAVQDLSAQIASAINQGSKVTYNIDGKQVNVVRIKKGGMVDDTGKSWEFSDFINSEGKSDIKITQTTTNNSVIEEALPTTETARNVHPQVKPTSPIGLASIANPKHAREMDKAALMDGSVADAMGTSKGEIIGSHLLPKLDDDFVKNNPDIAKDIMEMDKRVNELFEETNFDPFLVNVTERNDDKFKMFKAFSETHGAYYQQANSSFRESLGNIEGKARYGRNADFGFSSFDDAERAKKQLDERFVTQGDDKYTTNVVEDAGAYYVEMDWARKYDPFSARVFGENSADSSFAGLNTSGFTKGAMAKHIFPATTRLDDWVPKGAFTASVQASRVEGEFLKFIDKEITSTKFPREFTKAADWTQENGRWMNRGELSAMFPNIPMKELPQLERSYQAFKRLTDYTYLWADRKHTSDMIADGFTRGIYNKTGDLLGYAKELDAVPSSVRQVWDFDAMASVNFTGKMEGKQIVKLRDPVHREGNLYEYGLVGGNSKLDIIPHHTLPKVEGYIARKNVEPWYVTAIPKKLNANGAAVDPERLMDYARTIGAGKSRPDVEALAKKLEADFPDHTVTIKQEKGDIGDTILTDYKVYKEMIDWGNKRGERLPTLTGFARLEDPFVQQVKSIRSAVRLNAWQNYTEIFQKNFMAAYGRFVKDGKFPNVLTDLKPTNVMTPKDLDDFKVAQRLFEQYTNSQYKINMSDEVWKDTMHKIADVVEGGSLGGQAERIRDIANKGNLGLKSVKSLANTLFINLNPMAQWIVQPQSILEFSLVERGFREQMHMIPGIVQAIMARASNVKPYRPVLEDLAKFGIKDKKEFENIVDAIYKSGLPQSVDMNMMLHGGLDDMTRSLNPTMAESIGKSIAYIPDKVNQFGKAVGYSPAQLTADIGGWLFAKARWQKLNPGKNWNTPEHIAQITADGWDIMGSMHTRAGALPYQDGMLSPFFQFQSILHKNMFNMFASKTLKKAPGEVVDPKVKLAAARLFVYGKYGVPGYALIDSLVSNFADSDAQAEWNKWGGGMTDLLLNTTIDLFLSDPDTPPSDLALAARIGPMSESLPYYDLMHELVKFSFAGKSDTRVPIFNATGSVFEAARDFTNIFRATEVGTAEAFQMVASEVAEMSTGYKNWVKAQMIMEMQDKSNKFGKNLGLELTTKHAIGQMFGVVSQQELNQYKMNENKNERDEFIEQRASQIHQDLVKLKTKIGTPEFMEWVRRTNVLNTFTPEALQEKVFERVLSKDRDAFMNAQESNIMYIRDNAKAKNDKYIEEMLGYLKSCNSDVCQQNLKRLIDNGIVKGNE